jgi:hypothetical protein
LLLKDAPSLRQTVAAIIGQRMDKARDQVLAALEDHGEQPRVEIASLTFSEDRVLGDWLPEDPE